MMDEDAPDEPEPSNRQLGCLLGAVLAPVLILFSAFGLEDRGYLVVIVTGVLLIVLHVTRDANKENFYIGVVPPLFLAQFLCALLIPLPQLPYIRALMMPVAVMLLMFNSFIIRISQRLLGSGSR